MLEKTIENHLVKRVRAAGGMALKFVSPGTAGVPDRVVLLPGGRIVFVELKAPGKKLSPLQQRLHSVMSALGADVRVVDSIEGASEVAK